MSRTYKPFSGPFAPMLTEFFGTEKSNRVSIFGWLLGAPQI